VNITNYVALLEPNKAKFNAAFGHVPYITIILSRFSYFFLPLFPSVCLSQEILCQLMIFLILGINIMPQGTFLPFFLNFLQGIIFKWEVIRRKQYYWHIESSSDFFFVKDLWIMRKLSLKTFSL